MARLSTYDRGDTLIEMVVAFAILSLVVVGVLQIMNKGVTMSQNSIENTLVRQQMDGQADMVRYLHDTGDTLWNAMKAKATMTSDVLPLNMSSCPTSANLSGTARSAFYVYKTTSGLAIADIDGTTYKDPVTYARIDHNLTPVVSYGVWLQIAKAENKSSTASGAALTAYDVYIHGCWYGTGSSTPTTLGTIVRIYDQA